jgi:hypothetical protein
MNSHPMNRLPSCLTYVESSAIVKTPLRLVAVWVAVLGSLRGTESVHKFEVRVGPTIQYAHDDIWYHTPPETGPKFALTDKVVRHQQAYFLVTMVGPAVDVEGYSEVSYDLTIRRPDGTVSVEKKDLTAIPRGKVSPGYVNKAQAYIGFTADDSDPLGKYTVHLVAHDLVSGGQAEWETALTVVTLEELGGPPENFDPIWWLTNYYRRPEPHLALPALMALSHDPASRRVPNRQGPLLGFYEQVLAENPWLAPQFKQRFATTTDDDERRLLAQVLAYVYRDDAGFARDLPEPARQAFAAVPHDKLPLPSTEPMDGGQLDVYWGRFLASGRFQPIRDLVTVVQNYLPYKGQLEAYKNLKKKPQPPPPEVYKDVILGTALWSLGSNAYQHELVRNYLLYLLQAKDTPPEVKPALKAALSWKPKEQQPGQQAAPST